MPRRTSPAGAGATPADAAKKRAAKKRAAARRAAKRAAAAVRAAPENAASSGGARAAGAKRPRVCPFDAIAPPSSTRFRDLHMAAQRYAERLRTEIRLQGLDAIVEPPPAERLASCLCAALSHAVLAPTNGSKPAVLRVMTTAVMARYIGPDRRWSADQDAVVAHVAPAFRANFLGYGVKGLQVARSSPAHLVTVRGYVEGAVFPMERPAAGEPPPLAHALADTLEEPATKEGRRVTQAWVRAREQMFPMVRVLPAAKTDVEGAVRAAYRLYTATFRPLLCSILAEHAGGPGGPAAPARSSARAVPVPASPKATAAVPAPSEAVAAAAAAATAVRPGDDGADALETRLRGARADLDDMVHLQLGGMLGLSPNIRRAETRILGLQRRLRETRGRAISV